MLDTQYTFFSFKLISEEVNKMDKNLLINEHIPVWTLVLVLMRLISIKIFFWKVE